jgi:hypothetical protein
LVDVEQSWKPQLLDGDDGPVVGFGSGITVRAEGEFTVRDRTLPYDLTIRYGFDGQRFQVSAATYEQRKGRDPVKSELARKVPLDRLLRDHLARELPRTRSRLIVTPQRLVAVYRAAWACHVPPTQAVADAFGITTGAAEQRVFAARTKGLLPPTNQGKARG